MPNRRTQHPNAVLTPEGRRRMVACVLEKGWTIEATAERFQVDAKTVRKWRDRFNAEREAGLEDRSSRPNTSPNRTPRSQRRKVVKLRKRHRWGADRIAHQVGRSPSTVQGILNAEGLGRLDRGDRATASKAKPVRYERERPGELIHVDVKKLAAIRDGGGWRMHGRGAPGMRARRHAGYRYIHTAVDDRSRLAYSEVLDDEQAHTAAEFLIRAVLWFLERGVRVERVLTDNGSCYRSRLWARACADVGAVHKRTRPYRPQTNGKVERFHRILLEEWAYVRDWTSERERVAGYLHFMHFYNQHRPHGSLGWLTPMATLARCLGDNVSVEHT